MSKNEQESWVLFALMVVCLGFGLWVGIMAGENSERNRIVIDREHLIYDSVLYRKVVPDES